MFNKKKKRLGKEIEILNAKKKDIDSKLKNLWIDYHIADGWTPYQAVKMV